MGENFKKFKRKYMLKAALCGVIVGVCCGVAAAGAVLLALKLSAITIGWYFYLLIGLGAAAISGGAAFLIAKPSDVKIAKSLDSYYHLGEKVQTMVEFRGETSDVIELQRADTERVLAAVPRKKLSVYSVIYTCAAVAIAAAVLVCAVIVPAKTVVVPTIATELPYEMTESQKLLMDELILHVDDDEVIDDDLKTGYLDVLNNLYTVADGGTVTVGDMPAIVRAAMLSVTEYTEANVTFDDFYNELINSDAGLVFAAALKDSAEAYSSGTSAKVTTYSALLSRETTLYDTISTLITGCTGSVRTVINSTDSTTCASTINAYTTALGGALSAVDVSEDDALRSAVSRLNSSLVSGVGKFTAGTLTLSGLMDNVTTALNTYATSATIEMYSQSYTCMMDEYVRQSLGTIFSASVVGGITLNSASSGGSGGEEDDPSSSGGGGTGETLYGGDDYVYDPSDGTYKHYSELLNGGYYAKLLEQLSDSEVSDEVKSFITEYLRTLYNGIDGD